MNITKILEMGSRRAKWSEIWDSGGGGGVYREYVQLRELWPIFQVYAQVW